jgi:hypothetical protein
MSTRSIRIEDSELLANVQSKGKLLIHFDKQPNNQNLEGFIYRYNRNLYGVLTSDNLPTDLYSGIDDYLLEKIKNLSAKHTIFSE